jgi:hypothetical protein
VAASRDIDRRIISCLIGQPCIKGDKAMKSSTVSLSASK